MIDLHDLRARPDVYQDAAAKKNITVSVQGFLDLDDRRKAMVAEVDGMRTEKNRVSKEVPSMQGDAKAKAITDMKALGETLKAKEEELSALEKEWHATQLLFPSLPLSKVPVGKDDSQNVEVARWSMPPTFDYETKDHVALGEGLDLFDIPRGVKVAGSRSYFLKGDGARLYLAVMRYAMDHLVKKGWTLFIPPYTASWECLMGTGFFPGSEEQTYTVGAQKERGGPVESDDVYLIGTAEVSVASYHKDEVLPLSALPTRYAGYSPCFRREAGTYGKDTRGLYRVHQFEKVEQVVLCEADTEKALALFDEIRINAEDVLRELKLPYRIVDVCTGDMGKGKVYMQDIETWMPSRAAYSETQSCSYLGSFQARRLNIKYETAEGKKEFVHTLNNTCVAGPRILIPILETYQNADGSVTVPEVLRPYMGGQERIVK